MNDNPCGVRFEFQLNESVCSAAYSTEHCSEARWDQDNGLNKRKLTCTKITLYFNQFLCDDLCLYARIISLLDMYMHWGLHLAHKSALMITLYMQRTHQKSIN